MISEIEKAQNIQIKYKPNTNKSVHSLIGSIKSFLSDVTIE